MSMLSAQCDELRELATRYDELQAGAVKAVTMPSNMGSILREAADTIWELRDDLQRTHGLLDEAEHDESMAWDRVRKAEAEADRLREELEEAKHDLQVFSANLARLGAENAKLRELLDYMTPIAWYAASERERDRMRELGVEVES